MMNLFTKMTEAMSNLVVGHALTPGAHIGAVVDERQLASESRIHADCQSGRS